MLIAVLFAAARAGADRLHAGVFLRDVNLSLTAIELELKPQRVFFSHAVSRFNGLQVGSRSK